MNLTNYETRISAWIRVNGRAKFVAYTFTFSAATRDEAVTTAKLKAQDEVYRKYGTTGGTYKLEYCAEV